MIPADANLKVKLKRSTGGQSQELEVLETQELWKELDIMACTSLFLPLARDGIPDVVSLHNLWPSVCMTDYWPGPRSASQNWPLIGHSLTILASDWPRLASILYCPVSRVRGEYLGRSSLWVSYITFVSHTGDVSSGTFCHYGSNQMSNTKSK